MFGYVGDLAQIDYGLALSILARSVRISGERLEDIDSAIQSGHAQLWIEVGHEIDAVLVSRKFGDTLEIWHCAGKVLGAADRNLATIERAAREVGVRRMELTGRKGWERHLRKWGWKRDGDVIVKELD